MSLTIKLTALLGHNTPWIHGCVIAIGLKSSDMINLGNGLPLIGAPVIHTWRSLLNEPTNNL